MNYVVTEPALTSLTYAQKLTPATYAVLVQAFGSDSFAVAPYSKTLQQQLRLANPKDCRSQTQTALVQSVSHYV
jgi:hypothetical protein|tara:strand:+ start:655 stop:876 length:222 start_codon:yes stop_codon:yes gene_type:complete